MQTPTQFAEGKTLTPQAGARRWRRRTKVLVGVGGLIAVGGCVIALDLALSDRDTKTLHFDQPIEAVAVDMSGGSIRVVGTDESTITVEMSVRSGLLGTDHRERVENGRLVIETSCPVHLLAPSCEVDYIVHVPWRVSVEIEGDGLDAQVESIAGDLDVSINGGHVDAALSDAPRRVKARANGGDIDIEIPNDQHSYGVKASSNGGSTGVEVRTDPASDRLIDVHANGGKVRVHYP